MRKQQIVIRRSPMERRQLLINRDESYRLAEVAGGTAAECAAVVCCFPCTVVGILVLAVYKVPAGLCRKALRKKRRRRLLKKGLVFPTAGVMNTADCRISIDRTEFSLRSADLLTVKSIDFDEDFLEFENEMWENFYGTGFWRSLSQRVD